MTRFVPSKEQKKILAHEPGQHARILAGPGTGKSATLVGLLNRLFSSDAPPRVRLLTFTRAATGELAKKVADHPAAGALRPSTVHSFAISVLLQNPGAGNFPEPLRIADDWENEQIVRPTLAKRVGVGVKQVDRLIREMAANWQSLQPELDPEVTAEERSRFTSAWHEHREIYGYTLLAELPFALRGALQNHPDLEGVGFDLLIVDEYQDLNACDLGLLRLMADRGCSVIGAGDDDQSIYSFRKAAPEGIRRFRDEYSGAADYPLTLTRRCGPRIVAWANYVIQGDLDRPSDKLPLQSIDGAAPGETALLAFAGERAEAKGIARLIRSSSTKNRSLQRRYSSSFVATTTPRSAGQSWRNWTPSTYRVLIHRSSRGCSLSNRIGNFFLFCDF